MRYSPTAENSQKVEFAVIDESFDEFMELCASILEPYRDEQPRFGQFLDYVKGGMQGRNNPFTWEGRQVIVVFSRNPMDAILAAEQLDLMAFSMGLGGFHSKWILMALERDPERVRGFFPEMDHSLSPSAVFVIGHPRVRYMRTAPREKRKVSWR